MKAITVMALGGALLFAGAPAAESSSVAASRFSLTVRATTVTGTTTASATLTCDPDGGNHPRAQESCDLLRLVDGDVNQLTVPPGTLCLAVYQPHTVTIAGVWQNRRRYVIQRTFVNRCQMIAATGAIFSFAPR